MINILDIQKCKAKLIVQYGLVDAALLTNEQLRSILDNFDNLYAYTDKTKLLDTLDMMLIPNKSGDIDLHIKLLHFIAVQYELFIKAREYTDVSISTILDIIRTYLTGICKDIIPVMDIELLPDSLKEFYKKIMDKPWGIQI